MITETGIWGYLKYLSRSENWGNPDKMNGLLLILLDKIREGLGKPIIINSGYANDGHVERSQHYQGNAVDFYVDGLPFKDAYNNINKILHNLSVENNVGFGIYPDWNIPGFHLDVRGTKARWSGLKKNGKQEYASLDEGLKRLT